MLSKMDVVGSAASLLQLAHFVVSICIEVRATYKLTAGFDSSFDSAVLGAEIQVQRLLNWSEAVDISTCSPTLLDLLGRVLENVNNEVKNIEGYVEKYMPGKVEMLTRKSSSDHVPDVDSLFPPVPELVRVGKSNSTFSNSKGPSMIKRFHYIISHKNR